MLELLDPHRFTRGVQVRDPKQLEPVMVRRLKQDLREAGISDFPVRRVVQLGLRHEGGRWFLSERAWDPKKKGYSDLPERALGAAGAFELELSVDLARYTQLACPKKGRARLAFVTLQKRLLSSVEAFARTLTVHSEGKVGQRVRDAVDESAQQARAANLSLDVELYGVDEETREAEQDEEVRAASAELSPPAVDAKVLLDKMLKAVERHRHQPDAKVRALVDWISRHQCAAARVGGKSSAPPPRGDRGKTTPDGNTRWNERRLIVFTEYGDTKRYLVQQLSAAIASSDDADARIMQIHGGMGDEQRAEVQRAFNGDPAQYPVRILIATDAAREGINLQAHCADMIHFDVPWNPGRLEQRNGRIDRTLQLSDMVRCHYFSYAQRGEDPVLVKLVEKTEVITKELGSIAAVVMDSITEKLDSDGIGDKTAKLIDALASVEAPKSTRDELESNRKHLDKLKSEVEAADTILERSKKLLEFDARLLQDALDVGFELAGGSEMTVESKKGDKLRLRVPSDLPDSWQATLDSLRPTRERDEPLWKWRQKPPQAVTFEPTGVLGGDTVQLHLQHPVVQRVMSRFLAQGFSMGDLSRVTVVRNRRDAIVRVIAFGRLSLFGAGAARLHDQLISVAARWYDTRSQPLQPFAEEGDKNAVILLEEILLESPTLKGVSKHRC